MTEDSYLYAGDLPRTLTEAQKRAGAEFRSQVADLTDARLEASSRARSVLLFLETMEGWVVNLSRWLLEASATRRTTQGPAADMLRGCSAGLDPSLPTLMARAKVSGLVRRADMVEMLVQCAAHSDLLGTLVRGGAGLQEHTRYYWRPLHYAAALGSAALAQQLLDLGADPLALNGVGMTALHVAAAQASTGVASVLASFSSPLRSERDRMQRTPEDIALLAPHPPERCQALLRALRSGSKQQVQRRCAAAALVRQQQREAVLAEGRAPRPDACSGGGGWRTGCEGRGEGAARGEATEEEEEEVQPCDVAMLRHIEGHALLHDHLSVGVPVLLTEAMLGHSLYDSWRRDAFAERHGQVELKVEAYPYAATAAHLYEVSPNRSTVAQLLAPGAALGTTACDRAQPAEYIAETAASAVGHRAGQEAGGRLEPGRRSEPPQAVFNSLKGWRSKNSKEAEKAEKAAALDGAKAGRATARRARRRGDIEMTWGRDAPRSASERLVADWSRPPFIEDEESHFRTASIQFYLGPAGAGAQPHWHAVAWNWLVWLTLTLALSLTLTRTLTLTLTQVHGRKLWLLWPPPDASYAQRHVALTLEQLNAHVNASKGGARAEARASAAPLRCVQRAGDVMVVPEVWGHATYNLAPSIGWATELSFDRSFDGGFSASHGDEWWRVAGGVPPTDARPTEAPSASATPSPSPPATTPPAASRPTPSDRSRASPAPLPSSPLPAPAPPSAFSASSASAASPWSAGAVPTLVEVEVVPSLHNRAEGEIPSHQISSHQISSHEISSHEIPSHEIPSRDDGGGAACEAAVASTAARPCRRSALSARLLAAADEAEAVAAAAVAHAKALRRAADEASAGDECTASALEEVVTPTTPG